MPGAWTQTVKGEHLRGRRTRNTKPELALRSAVHGLGLRFRIHRAVAPRCTPDFVLPRYRLAVFVDGCFWHDCPEHGTRPISNASWWAAKLDANVARDRDTTAHLERAGWLVLRVWEHEPPQAAATAAASALTSRDTLSARLAP